MQHAGVVLHLLLPTDQDPPEPIHPAMSPLHHPTPGLETRLPLQPLQLAVLVQPRGPKSDEDTRRRPFLEAAVSRGVVADTSGIEGSPLAAGAEDEEDSVHGLAIIDPRIVTT